MAPSVRPSWPMRWKPCWGPSTWTGATTPPCRWCRSCSARSSPPPPPTAGARTPRPNCRNGCKAVGCRCPAIASWPPGARPMRRLSRWNARCLRWTWPARAKVAHAGRPSKRPRARRWKLCRPCRPLRLHRPTGRATDAPAPRRAGRRHLMRAARPVPPLSHRVFICLTITPWMPPPLPPPKPATPTRRRRAAA